MGNRFAALFAAVLLPSAPVWAAERRGDRLDQPVPASNPGEWIMADDYPPAALRADVEGTVVVTVDIDAAGHPTACTITRSSGSAMLDDAACSALRKRASFMPGKAGRTYSRTVRWAMPGREPGAPVDVAISSFPDTRYDMEITIGSNGAIESCRVIVAQPKEIDPCSQRPVGKNEGPGYVRNGKPVRMIERVTLFHSMRFVDVP